MKHPQNEKIEAGWANISGELLQDIPSGAVYLTHRSLTRFLFINDCDNTWAAFPSSSHVHMSEVSIWGNLTGWENEDLFGTLTVWETSVNPFATKQLDFFIFEEAEPVELPPIKQKEDTRLLFLVRAQVNPLVSFL
ncbi:hypothetical protein NLI92_002034 [Priestia megaterium]|jgi:hypothetical protein|uniref:hypothetical protein n=1 Tax=Priestia megaterium TaxID=1404 RepID=UPI0021AC6E72|nr:hypothetical protein [Priestia megaterium]MCR8926698.1 hypothetical protein [Priestia megaterium]